MKEIEKAIQEELVNVSVDNRITWLKLSLKHAELCLERGDSVESIIEFIKS